MVTEPEMRMNPGMLIIQNGSPEFLTPATGDK